jgi:signal transduction histidine kinase
MLIVTVGWALGGGALGWLVMLPARRRSFAGQLATPVVITTGASVAAFVGSLHAMYLPLHEFWVALSVSLAVGLLAALAVTGSVRRMRSDREGVREAVRAITRAEADAEHRPMTGELAALRAEVVEVAAKLADARGKQAALESAHRELLSFLARDLRVPLAQIEAVLADLQSGAADSPEQAYKQLHLEAETIGEMLADLSEVADAPGRPVASD